MTLTCCCGATLDVRDDWCTSHIEERFYKAHEKCTAHQDDDAAYWLRQYAGMAMQGVLSASNDNFVRYCSMGQDTAITESAIMYAKALLEAVKKAEDTNAKQ